MTGVWTPQWLYRHITIDAGETIRLSPGAFMNNEAWPLYLKWLSLAGIVTEDDQGEFADTYGGIARRLQFEFSMTQKGDINTLFANAQTLFADQQGIMFSQSSRYDFSPPFPLGPEEGMVAEVVNIAPVSDINRPAIMFTGRRKEREFDGFVPAHLGAGYTSIVRKHNSHTLDSIDLYNNGENTLWLQQMILDAGDFTEAGDVSLQKADKFRVAWRVNPNGGVQWMPNPDPIPVGNLAPMSSYVVDYYDLGPNIWVFPKGSALRPRQRLGVEVKNLSDKTQQFGLCLHGIMEVM